VQLGVRDKATEGVVGDPDCLSGPDISPPIKSQGNDMNQFVTMLSEYGLYLCIPLVFLAIVLWVYRPSGKKRYQADGNIPFDDRSG